MMDSSELFGGNEFHADFFGALSELFGGNEFHADFFGALSELPEYAFAVALFVIILALVGVFFALGLHGIDQAGELMGGGGYRLEFVHARAHSPEVGAEGRGSGQTQGLGGTIRAALSLAAHHLATGNLGARTQAQQYGEAILIVRLQRQVLLIRRYIWRQYIDGSCGSRASFCRLNWRQLSKFREFRFTEPLNDRYGEKKSVAGYGRLRQYMESIGSRKYAVR